MSPTTTHPTEREQSSIKRFALHYLEMVAAMFAGMIVLGIPAEAALGLAGSGYDELGENAPAIALLGMAVVMTVPMVAWMRFRGHSWRPCMEMAASMLVPTLAIIGLLAAGTLTDFMSLMMLEHVVMLPSMLAVMLLRWDEYAAPHSHHAATPRGSGFRRAARGGAGL